MEAALERAAAVERGASVLRHAGAPPHDEAEVAVDATREAELAARVAVVAARDVTVLLFARPRELLGGAPSLLLRVPVNATVQDARAALAAAAPVLAPSLGSCVIAIDDAVVDPDAESSTLCAAEIALIPPVSGG